MIAQRTGTELRQTDDRFFRHSVAYESCTHMRIEKEMAIDYHWSEKAIKFRSSQFPSGFEFHRLFAAIVRRFRL